VTTDGVFEQGPVVCLDPLELRSLCVDHVQDALATGEHLRRSRCGKRLHEYAGQVRVVLLSECASRLQDACSLGLAIDEDDDFIELDRRE
jgi:hypothetical protein